jgi:hypothetical protein
MAMCAACSAIVIDKRKAPGHPALEKIDYQKKRIIGQANIHLATYKCKVCQQLWQYEDDKNDDHAGWRKL